MDSREQLKSNLENERHHNLEETRYWCDQYKMLAIKMEAELTALKASLKQQLDQCTECAEVYAERDALKSAQGVMPERSTDTDRLRSNDEYNEGWNDCLDEFERLNRSKT